MSLAVYFFEIKEQEDFARCSNFLYKYTEHIPMSQEETERVGVKTINSEQNQDIKSICKKIVNKNLRFTTINRPILEFHREYDAKFILWMDEQFIDEIVQYQDAILIQNYFEQLAVYNIVVGGKGFYFKLSQYLYNIIRDRGMENEFFYLEREEEIIKRMQRQRIELSTSFFPLLPITARNLERLKGKCIDQIGKNMFDDVVSREEVKAGKNNWPELEGTLKIFDQNKKIFNKIEEKSLQDIVSRLDTLSWILLAYSMKNLSIWHEDIREVELRKYIEVIYQYANACFQLLENILFHSDAKWGVVSIRVHKSSDESDSKYLSKYYGTYDRESAYFEVIIRDYFGGTLSGNIAQHFRNNLGEREKKMFASLKPIDLFCSSVGGDNEFEKEWRDFYSRAEHICQHFGLRIFQRIVSDNEGCFIARSHKQYQCNPGDVYSYRTEKEKIARFVMPGTAYHILLPIRKLQAQIMDKDILHEYGNWLCGKKERFFTMQVYPFETFKPELLFDGQKDKEKYIDNMAGCIQEFSHGKKNSVLSVDTLEVEGKYAELYVKALIIALHLCKEKPYVILYNCSQEFMEQFAVLMKELYEINLEAMFIGNSVQIILVNKYYREVVYVPGSIKMTDCLNQYICRMKGIRCELLLNHQNRGCNIAEYASEYIPPDVFVKEGGMTLFQKCVKGILEGNIQKEEFGCKIVDTHMRLGSTIHINHFYEAEILLGVKYFRTRFAFLILRDIFNILKTEKKIMLYGYASYSEPLLVELKNTIMKLDDEIDVDYIVLEREEERRGFSHTDRIRYSNQEQEKNNEKKKYIIIVPINSTLKTHQRLISLLEEQKQSFEKSDVIESFALILVGTKDDNNYWRYTEESRLECKLGSILPDPKYYVDIDTEYYEPLTCPMCFPKNLLLEEPLIEVNAASTIPNQAFGIVRNQVFDKKKIKDIHKIIRREENKLKDLETCFLYGHYERNESHYLYYIQTEKLVTQALDKIRESLQQWKKQFQVAENEYHILVVPMHFSNCGFVEMVNDEVFLGMASIIRIDFNKDFRSNVYTKYSYIRQYIEQLGENEEVHVKFDYVDDNIITGATYFRAKSLIESVIDIERGNYGNNIHIEVFDRIFVLVDRNSDDSKKQYISKSNWSKKDEYYYVYLQLEISSLRNYGDSCVICNLYREAERLNQTASTEIVADYWEDSKKKFGLKPIEEGIKNIDLEFQERAFRRLTTTHIVKVVLNELKYNHQKENTMYILLNLLKQDFENREDKDEAFEYFVSYIKVISRPFLTFDKAIKEAIFDILLNIICYVVDEDYSDKNMKKEWKESKNVWCDIRINILDKLSIQQKKNLILVIMKQLTELKSNYIIRKQSIRCFCRFIEKNLDFFTETDLKDFWGRYEVLVKRLTGTSSDTSKSYWLDYMILRKSEFGRAVSCERLEWEPDLEERVVLENTRNFRDGIDKIYQRLPYEKDRKEEMTGEDALQIYMECILDGEYHNYCIKNMIEKRKDELLILQKEECREKIKQLVTDDSKCEPVKVDKIFKRAKTAADGIDECFKRFELTELKKVEEVLRGLDVIYSHQDYQYKNFQGFCEEIGWFKNRKYTKEGLLQIVNCLGIKRLCDNTSNKEMKILEKLKSLVNLISGLLGYCHVQLLIECESIAEYYVDFINEQYVNTCRKTRGEMDEDFRFRNNRHEYSVLASSTGYSIYLEDEVQRLMNDLKIVSQINEYGYYLDDENFVWRLGYDKRYPVYLCIKYAKDETTIYRLRNLMMYKWELENSVFDIKKAGYLHEIAAANNQLKLQKGRKNVSHTDIERRRREFQILTRRINANSDREKGTDISGEVNYPADMLILLADLRVSELYRQSLTRDFYNSLDTFSDICWGTEWNVLRSNTTSGKHIKNLDKEPKTGYDKEYPVHIHSGNVKLGESPIEDTDRLMVTEKMADELFSLLLVLVLNPGKVRQSRKNESKEVDVYISKTKRNTLRIANPTDCDERMLQRIRWRLEHEPMKEEDGITLWSMNCYLKRIKVTCAVRWLKEAGNTAEKVEKIKKRIEGLFGDDYQMKVDIVEGEGEQFFSCEIPLLWEKYDDK